MRGRRPWLPAILAFAAAGALACGLCVEDRVAAVYDYGVELQAGSSGQAIAYLGVHGRRAESAQAAALVAEVLTACPAVAAGTVRTSASPAAASFAWEGGEPALPAILASIRSRLAEAGLGLELLRTWDAKRGLH